jgi:hypothetical protein
MVHAIANQYNITIPESNILDLDYMNGWSNSTYRFIADIASYKLDGFSETVGNCVTEYTSKYKDPITGDIITVVYRVDSGD